MGSHITVPSPPLFLYFPSPELTWTLLPFSFWLQSSPRQSSISRLSILLRKCIQTTGWEKMLLSQAPRIGLFPGQYQVAEKRMRVTGYSHIDKAHSRNLPSHEREMETRDTPVQCLTSSIEFFTEDGCTFIKCSEH